MCLTFSLMIGLNQNRTNQGDAPVVSRLIGSWIWRESKVYLFHLSH
jgi:hypothetical protein